MFLLFFLHSNLSKSQNLINFYENLSNVIFKKENHDFCSEVITDISFKNSICLINDAWRSNSFRYANTCAVPDVSGL